jgi:hypothetical protein
MDHRFWISLTSKFSIKRARTRKAQLELTLAYKRVFTGTSPASIADKQTVLADLANAASWGKYCPATTSDAQLRQTEGARELFSRVFAFIGLSASEIEALREAARHEAQADEQFTPAN